MSKPVAMGCERFLILARTAGPAAANLQSLLGPFGKVEVVGALRGISHPVKEDRTALP